MSDINDCRKSVERLTRDRGEVMSAGNDEIAEIRARHLRDDRWCYSPSPQMHDDRAALLAEVERLNKDLATQQGCCDGAEAQDAHIRQERDEARAEVTRMQELLRGISINMVDLIEQLTRERDAARAENDRLRAEIERLRAENERLRAALTDMLSGWRYIRETYGDLAGIGWDRAESKAQEALEGKP